MGKRADGHQKEKPMISETTNPKITQSVTFGLLAKNPVGFIWESNTRHQTPDTRLNPPYPRRNLSTILEKYSWGEA